MPWPTVPVVTTGMDADADALPRTDILDHTQKFNDLIAMRAVANGVCDLDASALIPSARLPAVYQPIDPQLTTIAGISAQQATDFTTLSTFVGGLLNDIDAATFRSSIGANAGTVTGVTGTAPIVSSGGATPAISIPAATASVAGHMTAAQAAKLDGITAGSSVMVFKSLGSADGFTEYMDTYASYSTFSSAAVRVPFACTLKNMICVAKDVATTPTLYQYTLYKNGAAQAFVSTTNSGLTQSSNTTNTITCVAGDLISVAVYCNLTGTTVVHHVSLEVIKS